MPLTEEQKQSMAKLYQLGASQYECADMFGISQTWCGTLLREMGVETRSTTGHFGNFWHEENRVERLRGLWDAGWSASRIGRHLGCTKNAVIGKAHRLKLKPRPSPIPGRA